MPPLGSNWTAFTCEFGPAFRDMECSQRGQDTYHPVRHAEGQHQVSSHSRCHTCFPEHLDSCVGVWDTVGSVFRENNALDIKDNSLPESVDVALHALSFHENRLPFLPTLWEEPKGGLRKGQILKQVCSTPPGFLHKFCMSDSCWHPNSAGSLEHMPMSAAVMNTTNYLTFPSSGWRCDENFCPSGQILMPTCLGRDPEHSQP